MDKVVDKANVADLFSENKSMQNEQINLSNLDPKQMLGMYIAPFFDELIRCGVEDVVISPGSRSTPLAIIAYKSTLNTYVDIDERGAAFFALGLAKVKQAPTVLLCTSGTALANYYPAIIEAESSRVALIILSADRPSYLQNLGAPQTFDQLKAFSNHVIRFWNMPEPGISLKKILHVRQVAREACITSGTYGSTKGPVHINFPFDEPLTPTIESNEVFKLGRLKENISPYLAVKSRLDKKDIKYLSTILKNKKTIILCGENTLSSIVDQDKKRYELNNLIQFAQLFDAPLLADPLSNLRSFCSQYIIETADNIVKRNDVPNVEVVIRFGRYPISKSLTTYIASKFPIQIVVDPFDTRDFNSQTSMFIPMNPCDFVFSMIEDNPTFHIDQINTLGNIENWQKLNTLEEKRLNEALQNGSDNFEGSYIANLVNNLPKNSLIFSANSMSIRTFDMFYIQNEKTLESNNDDKNITLLANRGLNGIDGTISSALGAAQNFAHSILITGDLAFIHDLNALALQNELLIKASERNNFEKPKQLIIVVFNNNGGAIFDSLPQKSEDPYFKRLFLTPQNVSFMHVSEAFSIYYSKVCSVVSFKKALGYHLKIPGISIIEIPFSIANIQNRYNKFRP